MRVLLILPRTLHNQRPKPSYLPVGIACLVSVLREHGHEVSVFDRSGIQARVGLDRSVVDRAMLDHARSYRPDLVGFKTISPIIYDTAHCARLLRSIFNGPMIAGGPHATALPELTLKKIPELKGVVAGEGEEPLRRLAAGDDPRELPGVYWKSDSGQITGHPPEQLRSLDSLPFPRFDVFDMDHYTRRSLYPVRGHLLRSISLLSSRGCYRRCDFCCESLTYGKGVRFHSPHYVLEMVERAARAYPLDGVYFLDNDFLADPDRASRICDLLKKRGWHRRLQWAVQARADRVEPAILKQLRSAGCGLIEIGIESPLQTDLDSVHKHTSTAQNQRAIELCRRHRIGVHAYMIVGFPGETLAHLRDKTTWLKRVRPSSFSFSPLLLLPGTRLYERLGEGFFEREDWTEDTINGYYHHRSLADFSASERERWLQRHVIPHQSLMRRWYVLNHNPPARWPLIFHNERKSLKLIVAGVIDRFRRRSP